ncbi:MAG TPA: hypothetical protein VMC80_03315, partial [Patescibacteria group bacterium]|nr:hypothetical protein [Patescibacteria group bacterium]
MESEKKENESHSGHLVHPEPISHHRKTFTEKMRENPWIISTFVFGIIIIILLLGTFFGGFPGTGNAISTQSAGSNVVNFLNKYIVPSGGIVLNSVEEDKISGVYYANVTYNGNTLMMPVSKDGKYTDIGGGMINMITYASYMNSKPASSSSSTTQTTNVPKTDKPTVELFVMSYCPYGTQMEKAIIPVLNLLKDKVNFTLRF